MDRHEWGETFGDYEQVGDDLRWTLFQAERNIQTMLRQEAEEDRPPDDEILQHNQRRVRDSHTALAAIWQRQEADNR